MDYWAETIQDDAYLIAANGWVKGAQPREIVQVKDKNNKLTWPEPHDYLKGKRRASSQTSFPPRFSSPATSSPNATLSKSSTTSSPRSSNTSTRCARRTAARMGSLPR